VLFLLCPQAKTFLNHLYGGMGQPELKIIDVFICKLAQETRECLRRPQLHRKRVGRSYVLREPHEVEKGIPA
jgi:hypothetical protein